MRWRTKARLSDRTSVAFRFMLCLAITACLADSEPTPAEPGLPSTLVVRPNWAAIQPTGSVQLEAAIVEQSGDTVPQGPVAWSTRSSGVIVDSTGRATGITLGVDTVIASFGQFGGYGVVVVSPPVLVGAGDIATCTSNNDEATAALLDTISGVVFTAGDNAYQLRILRQERGRLR